MTDGKQLEHTPIVGLVRDLTPEQYLDLRMNGKGATLTMLLSRMHLGKPCITMVEASAVIQLAETRGCNGLAEELQEEFDAYFNSNGNAEA